MLAELHTPQADNMDQLGLWADFDPLAFGGSTGLAMPFSLDSFWTAQTAEASSHMDSQHGADEWGQPSG